MPYPPKCTAAPYYVPQGPRRIITGLSFHDVRLNKSANAWKPGWNRESLPADRESQGTQDLLKKFRSILNKLTPENFPQLIKQVMDLNINTEERLKGVVELVFEKAIDEPSFSVTYGNMCRCLAELKVPTTADPNNTVSFIKLLGSSCKKEFDKYKEDDVVFGLKRKELDSAASTDRDRLQVELQEAERISRRRSVGNAKFIGEIFKLNLIQTSNIRYCVNKMLDNHQEKSLECLCTLLTTIGRDFEVAKPQMDAYFNQMQSIVREGQTSSRIRFMLEEVIELRLHNWVSRKPDKGPKTLEQIHQEAKIEEQEVQRKVQEQLLSKDTKRQPDPSKQRDQRVWNNSRTTDPNKSPTFSKPINLGVQGPPPSKGVRDVDQLHKSENAWKPGRNRESLPAEKALISRPQLRPQMDKKTQLGPRAQVTWVKGSGGGAKASDSDNAPKLQQVVEETSSPGLVQREGPVDRREAPPTPPASELELPLSASLSNPVLLPATPADTSERPSATESATYHLSSVGEHKPSLATMKQHMERVLLDDMSSEQQIFNCVKKKVDKSPVSSSPYLRELMTAVCKAAEKENTNCRVHAALLQKRLPVVVKYRNSESERQRQALDELQALTVTLDEPQDLLRIFFDCHCDEDVISENAFCKYEIRKEPADLLGKGVALKSVTAFFTWLREAESED